MIKLNCSDIIWQFLRAPARFLSAANSFTDISLTNQLADSKYTAVWPPGVVTFGCRSWSKSLINTVFELAIVGNPSFAVGKTHLFFL